MLGKLQINCNINFGLISVEYKGCTQSLFTPIALKLGEHQDIQNTGSLLLITITISLRKICILLPTLLNKI